MTLKPILLTLAIALITACGNSSTDSSEDAATRSEPDLPGEGYDRALERARGVEQDVMDAAQRQREQIDDQEGGN